MGDRGVEKAAKGGLECKTGLRRQNPKYVRTDKDQKSGCQEGRERASCRALPCACLWVRTASVLCTCLFRSCVVPIWLGFWREDTAAIFVLGLDVGLLETLDKSCSRRQTPLTPTFPYEAAVTLSAAAHRQERAPLCCSRSISGGLFTPPRAMSPSASSHLPLPTLTTSLTTFFSHTKASLYTPSAFPSSNYLGEPSPPSPKARRALWLPARRACWFFPASQTTDPSWSSRAASSSSQHPGHADRSPSGSPLG